ncbi:MAG TPA: sigma-70 family RNA polymerase sigma factor [Planctomycetaceae bacterium]|nr:sigma-70 family RNA polymerase sigma factor [Planctomycetaceae bacterium]HQZ67150.1 sigma-70 family RNA polymerase sigma factor [Planctomycetaceae bacterium]
MSASQPILDSSSFRPKGFRTTRWSMVLAAGGQSDFDAGKSLASLCEQYWSPIYAFVRFRGHGEHDAQDLTQAFFAQLLEKNWLASADQQRGRFRTFLLTAVKRFLANEWDRDQTLKRGGGVKVVNMDSSVGILIPDPRAMPADRLFERQWALAMLETVLNRLEAEFARAGKSAEYKLLKPSLTAPRNSTDYDVLAAALSVQPVSARSAVHRLRKRFKELFREEVSHTVDDAIGIDEELRAVIAALATYP